MHWAVHRRKRKETSFFVRHNRPNQMMYNLCTYMCTCTAHIKKAMHGIEKDFSGGMHGCSIYFIAIFAFPTDHSCPSLGCDNVYVRWELIPILSNLHAVSLFHFTNGGPTLILSIKIGKAGDSAPKVDASTPLISLASPIRATNRHKINKSIKPDQFSFAHIVNENHAIHLVK